jgi:hypothetical protein
MQRLPDSTFDNTRASRGRGRAAVVWQKPKRFRGHPYRVGGSRNPLPFEGNAYHSTAWLSIIFRQFMRPRSTAEYWVDVLEKDAEKSVHAVVETFARKTRDMEDS